MTDLDNYLDTMRAAWSAIPNGDGSISQMRAHVRQGQAAFRREASLEALVSLAASGVFVFWALRSEGFVQAIFIGLAAFAMAWLAIMFQLRQKVWQMQGETVEAYRSFLQRRAQTGLFLARIGYVGGPLGLLAGLGLGSHDVLPKAGLYAHYGIIWIAAAAFAASWGWSMIAARRHKRTLENLQDRETIPVLDTEAS
jgi:hypothetical protein